MYCEGLFLFCLISLLLPVSCQDSDWDTEWEGSTKQSDENPVKAQQLTPLGTKYRKLVNKARRDAVIQVNSPSRFEHLISTPRNYSLILLITSDYKCENCQQAFLSVRSIARSYIHSEENIELFFIESRYEKTPEIFRKVCGKPLDVPALFYLPWPGKLKDLQRMDNHLDDFSPSNIIYWIQDVTGSTIHDTSSQNEPSGSSNGIIFFICFTLFSIFTHRERLKKFNETEESLRSTFAIIIIVIKTLVLLCTSGQVYNHIENTSFSIFTQSGQWYWMIPSMRSQLGLESYAIFALTASHVAGLILVVENGSKLNIPANRYRANLGIVTFSVSFVVILFIARLKM